MKHVCIVLPEGAASVGCIEGAAKMFSVVNTFLEARNKPPFFDVKLVAADRQPRIYDGIFSLTPNYSYADNFPCHLAIIPAVNGDMKQVIASNQHLVAWARNRHQQGTELASLCVGAFLLASTGLLHGKR